ncbi:MAG TPA: tRNA (adenosine(37)-N6)-threonylcarbamoyltransferase complex ATPase subunit type 1 TsaE [Burkholderiaceae bacterium]|nr:tRNA (adenosine(37)-N6)-threonylcarbamoyltransferase complex ATPase subunit type 1 TsaE [Burkholderiaceae bacterium]
MNPAPYAVRETALPNDEATSRLGAALASVLPIKLHIHLHGDLGAGKTSLVRGMLRALGHVGSVKSPTYALVESYTLTRISHTSSKTSNLYFQHFDFYRFNRDADWLDAGFRDVLASDAICAIEWPEQAGDLLPPPDLDVRLTYAEPGRHALIEAWTPLGADCLARLVMT